MTEDLDIREWVAMTLPTSEDFDVGDDVSIGPDGKWRKRRGDEPRAAVAHRAVKAGDLVQLGIDRIRPVVTELDLVRSASRSGRPSRRRRDMI